MIKLFQFPPHWNIPNASPFCLKVETYLRMTKLPYQPIKYMDPRKAPMGKLPFIEDNGRTIADSSLIISYLKKTYGDKLDAALTSAQHAQSILIQRMLDNHLYWCMLYSRWIDDTNWTRTKQDLFAKVPALLRPFIANSVRKSMRANLHAHGLGRHHKDEIYQSGIDDLTTLTHILQANAFLLGNEPASIDASGYGFLANLIHVPIQSPINEFAKSQPCFINYCARMKALYYP